jgi:hypothetical protein
MANNSIRSHILQHLESLAPLTVVTLSDLYELPFIPENQKHSVRAAIYGLCSGTPVSERDKPPIIYGIRLKLRGHKQVILSLPGLSRASLQKDHKSDCTIDRIISRFKRKYGAITIDFWAKSAQKRSVDQASAGMRAAKSRDGHTCILCREEGVAESRLVTACHIVSRKASFWLALDEVDKTKNSIFSEEATRLLADKLKKHEPHSGSRFIVTLCKEHNDLLLKALSESLSSAESAEQSQGEDSLFGQALPTVANDPVRIIEIGGEGGSITLYGLKSPKGGWVFKLSTDNRALEEMLGEGPLPGDTVKPGTARTWGGALRLLSRYPWKRLYPRYVHPEFKDLVLKEIECLSLKAYERAPWLQLFDETASVDDHSSDFWRESDIAPDQKEIYARKAALLKRALKTADLMDREGGL